MAGTYSQMHVQIVFAVKSHQSSYIKKEHKNEIEKYIAGIIANNHCKLLAIFCNPDHVHILIGLRPSVLLSDLVRKIKSSSSKFIHEKFDKNKHFAWQEGYTKILMKNIYLIDPTKIFDCIERCFGASPLGDGWIIRNFPTFHIGLPILNPFRIGIPNNFCG